MKTIARLLLLGLAGNLAASAAGAGEHHEAPRVKITVVMCPVLFARLATVGKPVSQPDLSERLSLTPRLANSGAIVRVNLNF